ncbi:unnamed protein product [Gongylonema pulchrum]|uniref:Cadherin domain-containing protein n=1 Tax=Gongylonema pulchrum TaxID=637853 RepID=A0A3P7MJC6_9BILA|nr:unnamed protein product [Gongylonema pulchrum]
MLVTGAEDGIDDVLSLYDFTIPEHAPKGHLRVNYGLKEALLQATDTYLDIKVISKIRPHMTKTVTVHITVSNQAGNALQWLHDPINLVVPENSPAGTFIGILRTNELHGSEKESSVEYRLSGHPRGISVDSHTGVIRATAPFDYEEWLPDPINLVVPENSPAGTFIGILRTNELHGREKEINVEYRLQGHPRGISVDSHTGVIRATAPFDYEEASMYSFKAVAQRADDAETSMECDVFLFISDRNDNPPRFRSHDSEVRISENTAPGYTVIQLEVDDLDTAVAQRADDAGTSTECDVFLFISDRNDNPPRFRSHDSEVRIPEDTAPGYTVIQLEVDDLDTDNEFIYEISAVGNERGLFGIKPDGQIFLLSSLDREQEAFHHLAITVYDRKNREYALKATTSVKIIVLDVNDNAPQFTSPTKYFIRNQIDTVEQNEFRILVEATDYGLPKRLSSATWITVVVLGNSKRLPTLKKIYHATVHEGAQVGQIVAQISNVSSSAAAVFGVMLKIEETLFSIYNYKSAFRNIGTKVYYVSLLLSVKSVCKNRTVYAVVS